jgi:hypothetical protein
MYAKKLLICAFLFFICYLILSYLNKNLEAFGCRGRGCGSRGYYGGGFNRNFNRGYGYPLNRRNVYPVVVDNYPSYLYPSYFYSLFY